jgi:phospholipid/cholesterol/gamma-HCH transport system permease protein
VYNAVALKNFVVGVVKTPFFAFFIAFIGYHRGMMVQLSAESLGRETTNSVVQAIFAVIAFDALFSVFVTRFGI